MKSFAICFLFLAFSIAEGKFSRGDEFQSANIEGQLTINCGNKTTTVTCRDVFMDPWPYDIFMGARIVNAEILKLQSTVGNKTSNSQVDYNGAMGRSEDINLGVNSLFQKPLLRVGENRIRYSLISRNNIVLDTDTFNVSVTRGKSRECGPRETKTQNAQDCEHTYTLCQLYFRNQNFCH